MSGVATELRPVGREDWELLRDVRLRALADAPNAFGTTLRQARKLADDEWRSRVDGGGSTILAVDDGVALAMGGAFAPADRPTVFVWGMWTDPVARGRGIGGLVLDALVSWCRSPDRDPAFAEVRLHVTEGNADARRLYVGRGFAPTGAWEPLREGSALRIEELGLTL